MEYPLAASDKPGWDLAAEFVNMYLGTGGEFFADGSAELAIDNDNGRKVLDTMRAMTTFMNPDYLTYDATELNKLWDAGTVAFMNQWGSLAGAATDPAKANPEIAAATGLCGSADHQWRHDPGCRAVVGWLHHRQEHLGRRCRRLVPGHGARHQPRNRGRQPAWRQPGWSQASPPARPLLA